MRDVYKPLRQAYYALLAGAITVPGETLPVPVRYPMLAQGEQRSNYLLISGIESRPFNSGEVSFADVFVTFTIVTRSDKNNSGDNADYIADKLYEIVYPDDIGQQVLLMSAGQCVNTTTISDTILPYLTDGQRVILNRVIKLSHIIQFAKVPRNSNIYYGVQDTTDDPVDFSHSYFGDPALPITINYGNQAAPKIYWVAYPMSYAKKTAYQDLNEDLNSAPIDTPTSLFTTRIIVIDGDNYWCIIGGYKTTFGGDTKEVKFY